MFIRRSRGFLDYASASILALATLCTGACSSDAVTPADIDMAAPTPTPPDDPPLPRLAIFSEIHFAPVDKTSRQEFVEIQSVSSTTLDLSGWRITGGIGYTFPAGTGLAPGALLVVAQDPTALSAKFPGVVALGPYSGRLSSSGDTVILRDELSRRRDEVEYGRGFPWPTGGGDTGYSIELMNPSLDGRQGGSWRLSAPTTDVPPKVGPTPGAKNASYDDNPPPIIRSVKHLPTAPRSNDPVTISVELADPDGISEVKLEYQIVDPGAYIRLTDTAYSMGWVSVPLRDDGQGGDVKANDGTYSATLDASLSKHRRLMRYRVTATDGQAQTLRVPYADDPQPNFAYFVYDGVPAWRGASQPGTTPVQDFGADVLNRLPIYHLIAQETDVINSQYVSGYESLHFFGTVVEGNTVYDHIEFENRGEFSVYVSGKNKWRLHFQRGHEFQSRDDFGRPRKAGLRTMNLSACATPWVPTNRGMACLDESVAFRLYELAGVPSPHMNYLQFRVIDEAIETHPTDQYRGDLWGLYGTIEHTDGAFLDERGLPDGNVYKIEGGQGDKRNQGPLPPTTSADYDTFRNGFNSAQPITWWRSNLDLPGYYSMRSVDRIVNNMDMRDGWNHCQYHNPVTNLWTAMPWDLDMLYMPVTHWSGVLNLQNSIMQHAELMTEYRNRGRELLDLLVASDQLGALIDEQAAFVGQPATGGTLNFSQLDQAMWNYHPRTASAHRGAFYRNPSSTTFRGGTVNRTLVSADHAGMARWIKDFTLTGYGATFLDSEVNDTAIPNRPTISYAGAAGFPLDGVVLKTDAFSDPQGSNTFAGMQWRVAEITPASTPPDIKNPRRYEVQAAWQSPILTSFSDTIAVPPESLRVGAVHRARVRMIDNTGRASRWSAPLEFTVAPPQTAPVQQTSLRITEINYRPRSDRHEEFIEIANIGDSIVDLRNVALTSGVRFRFADSTVQLLAPGQRVVVVENIDDFRARYGSTVPIAGQYADRLSNGGERIVLTYGQNLTIQDFDYNDAWQARTDGGGYTLEIIDPRGALSTWSTPAAWRESTDYLGSPGR